MRSVRVLGALVVASLIAGCGPGAAPTPSLAPTGSGPQATVRGIALAGPVCPVVTPSASGCEDRPVAGAVVVVRTAPGGAEVGRATSDEDGRFEIRLAAGSYRFEPQPVEGLLGTAPPVEVVVREGQSPEPIVASYDTGIR